MKKTIPQEKTHSRRKKLPNGFQSTKNGKKVQVIVLKNAGRNSDEESKFSSLGRMTGMLAHEMVNPLDGITRYVELALKSAPDNPAVREFLLEAKQGLVRVSQLTRSILNYSWDLSREECYCNLYEIVEEGLRMFECQLKALNIHVIKDWHDDAVWVKGQGLEFAVNNIIKNACEAMPRGGTLTITTNRRGRAIELNIADTGCGISPEDLPRIFEPFFTTKDKGKGSGFGLAFAHQIIRQAQGSIGVQSALGQGTEFTIILPAQAQGFSGQGGVGHAQ